jgi:transcriptional regulator with XRE-family HTH domain
MNARDYLKKHGWKAAEDIAIKAGTTKEYFSQLAYGHRRPSVGLAERLVIASSGKLDFVLLLKGFNDPP